MKVALYARVSTADQDETLQLPTLRDYAKLHNWEIVGEYTDEASARDANRPGWQALRSDSRLQNFDAVLVTKLDRIMRSLLLLVKELDEFGSLGIKIIALNYGVLDMGTASSKLTIQVLGAVAEWEREINSERTREGLQARKRKGIKLGRPTRKDVPIHKAALLILEGKNWSQTATALDLPRTTLRERKQEIIEEMKRIQGVK